MKPMLAATLENLSDLRYPVLASAKLDGVRGLVVNGKLLSRSLKPIPNKHVNNLYGLDRYNGLDGELVYGNPTDKDVYRKTVSAVMKQSGEPQVTFYVFDFIDIDEPYKARQKAIYSLCKGTPPVLPQYVIEDEKQLLKVETEMLESGYEGLILRDPNGRYKFGRSTVKEGLLLKLKRFTDSEALLLDVEEEMENTNVAKKNELGRTERSSAKAGLVGKDRAGTLVARDIETGVEFRVGTGLNDEDKAWFWKHKKKLIEEGFIFKYKSFLVGVKDLPRFPVYLGPREKWDL